MASTENIIHNIIPSHNVPSLYPHPAPLPLHIIIVGCGLGGLSAAYCLSQAGHNITVLESAPQISDVGAGIQVGPNLTRLLRRWGCGRRLEEVAVVPEGISFRRWKTGERVGYTKWGKSMEELYGAPYYHVHRADLLNILYDLASPHMSLHLSSRVASISSPSPSNPNQGPTITLTSGQTLTCDLLIGADGLKSTVRDFVLGCPDKAVPTGDAAYRAVIGTEEMWEDEDLRGLVEKPEMTAWMGPGKHIMGYCIRGKKEYNLVLLHPDDGSTESWTAEGSADKMRADFEDWEPRIQKLLALVPSTLKWKLMEREPLETWVHRDGRVALLGDACHPMLPYRAQGSAMAVEDASVLSSLLSHLSHPSQLPYLLRAYQGLRHARTAETQRSSRENRRIFHLGDGVEQRRRDEEMRRVMMGVERGGGVGGMGGEGEGNPNQWADKRKSLIQFGYDADAEAEKWWREEGERVCSSLVLLRGGGGLGGGLGGRGGEREVGLVSHKL